MSLVPKFNVGDEVVFVGKTNLPAVTTTPIPFVGTVKIKLIKPITNWDEKSYKYIVDTTGYAYYEDEIKLAHQSDEEEDMTLTSVMTTLAEAYKAAGIGVKNEVLCTVEGVGKDEPIQTNEKGGSQSIVKYRLDLVDPLALLEIARCLKQGADKYGEENWRKIDVKDHINHLLIHTYAYLANDHSDDHLTHIACRAIFALAVDIASEKEEEKKNAMGKNW